MQVFAVSWQTMVRSMAYQPQINRPLTVQKVVYSFDGLAMDWLPGGIEMIPNVNQRNKIYNVFNYGLCMYMSALHVHVHACAMHMC